MFPFERLFRALNDNGVRYVVVGGVAVVLHGYVRYTADLDLVVDLAPEEARKAMTVMVAEGFTPRVPVDALDFADPEKRREWVEEKNMIAFSMLDRQTPPNVVDIIFHYPLAFEEVWSRSVTWPLDTTSVRTIALNDLMEMKRAAGRPKDLIDLAELEAIRRMGDE